MKKFYFSLIRKHVFSLFFYFLFCLILLYGNLFLFCFGVEGGGADDEERASARINVSKISRASACDAKTTALSRSAIAIRLQQCIKNLFALNENVKKVLQKLFVERTKTVSLS